MTVVDVCSFLFVTVLAVSVRGEEVVGTLAPRLNLSRSLMASTNKRFVDLSLRG